MTKQLMTYLCVGTLAMGGAFGQQWATCPETLPPSVLGCIYQYSPTAYEAEPSTVKTRPEKLIIVKMFKDY